MGAAAFCEHLEQRLGSTGDTILLRIVDAQGVPEELTGAEIVARGRALSAQYAADAPAGSVVLLLLPHSAELFLLHLGLVLTGHVPAILAWPTSRVDAEKYQRNLLHQLSNLPAERLITIPALAQNLGDTLPYQAVACAVHGAERWEQVFTTKVHFEAGERVESHAVPLPAESDALFLQFSGGTTGAQKAVVITSDILERQLDLLAEALAFDRADSIVSWLPMYHDMGLIACLWLPLWHGASSLHFAASDWLLNPGVLFDYIERYRGTLTWLPNFAFSYLAAQFERVGEPRRLGSMRAWINCSEPVRNRSIHDFAERYAAWGVRSEHLQACYAMAENVFAVTQTRLGEDVPVYPRALLRNNVTDSNGESRQFDLTDEVYVGSGPPLREMQIRITDPKTGAACPTPLPARSISSRPRSSAATGAAAVCTPVPSPPTAGTTPATTASSAGTSSSSSAATKTSSSSPGRTSFPKTLSSPPAPPKASTPAAWSPSASRTSSTPPKVSSSSPSCAATLNPPGSAPPSGRSTRPCSPIPASRPARSPSCPSAGSSKAPQARSRVSRPAPASSKSWPTRHPKPHSRSLCSKESMIDSIDAEKVRIAARKVVEKQLGYAVADDDTLVSSGLIDSLSVVQLIAALEKELNIHLPAATLQPDDFDTIDYTVETVMRVAK